MPVLLEVLTDAQNAALRITAALTLGQIGRQNSIPDLQNALRDPQPEVREAAFIALCLIGRIWDVSVLGK
jgi:HEAT repeat protein